MASELDISYSVGRIFENLSHSILKELTFESERYLKGILTYIVENEARLETCKSFREPYTAIPFPEVIKALESLDIYVVSTILGETYLEWTRKEFYIPFEQ